MKFTVATSPLNSNRLRDKVAKAVAATEKQVAVNAIELGRRNIAAAGHFTSKWQQDLQFRMISEGMRTVAIVFHKSPLAGIFESGATIAGKPRVWIPITPSAPPIKRSGKRLTFAIIRGHYFAFDKDDRDRKRRPLYIGVPTVHIRKLWHITQIVKEQIATFASLFRKFFESD